MVHLKDFKCIPPPNKYWLKLSYKGFTTIRLFLQPFFTRTYTPKSDNKKYYYYQNDKTFQCLQIKLKTHDHSKTILE